MSRPPAKNAATPEAAFLSPLQQIAARDPDAEAFVFWANPQWSDEPTEDMDAGEIAFYAEGLIPEGFHMEWRIHAEEGAKIADHIALFVWEAGGEPPPQSNWHILGKGRWPA